MVKYAHLGAQRAYGYLDHLASMADRRSLHFAAYVATEPGASAQARKFRQLAERLYAARNRVVPMLAIHGRQFAPYTEQS